jgi:hypothetical protein
MASWPSIAIIGNYNSLRTPIQKGVLFDYNGTACYNMGAKAGGYPQTDLQGHWSMEGGVPVGWNDGWQGTIYTNGGYDHTVSISQGDLGNYPDSASWQGAFYQDIQDRVLRPELQVTRVIYYSWSGSSALSYWEKTVDAVKSIYTDPVLRAAWLAAGT